MELVELVVALLAVWRVTHLFQAEDGPWDLSARLRRVSGNGAFGKLLDCFYCLSLWVAIPPAVLLAEDNIAQGVLLWLALSGGAVIVQRMLPPEIFYVEDEPGGEGRGEG